MGIKVYEVGFEPGNLDDFGGPVRKRKAVSKAKAKEILRHGSVRGHKLTKKQKGFFGARAGGAPVKRRKKRRKGY